jgi:uncharacterized RDD family membrane protein YckC
MKAFGIVFAILFIIALVIAGPLLVIWSLNLLFGLGIDYTIWTWAAVAILGGFFRAKVTYNKQ